MAVLPITLPADEGSFQLSVTAESQLCREGNAGLCYPPALATSTLEISVTPGDASTQAASVDESSAPEKGGLEGRLTSALNGRLWLAFLIVFIGGFLTSLTPCVLPMIPITIGFIGMSAKGSAIKGFVLSLWYVLGIALIYSTLGVLSAAAGGAFGQFTQTPWFMGPIALIIFIMGLSMAGLFEMKMPDKLMSQAGGGKTGFLGPLLMGMAMGIVAVACVGPVLVVLLTWVATTGSLFLGFWLLFTFALGMGVLFIIFGTFGGMLPTGGWMNTVKHVFALLMFGLALSFVRIYIPGWLLPTLFGLAMLLSVSAWGAWNPLSSDAGARAGLDKGIMRFLWLFGAALAILGSLNGLAPGLLPAGSGGGVVSEEAHQEPAWIMDETDGFAEAARDGKPVMMDFYADWCAACLELDHQTYNQTEILDLANSFVSIKMDLTARSEVNSARNRKYQVVGMPTVIFFDSNGKELERFSGFKDADDMAEVMQRVLQHTK
jgi:thioredoxin:protein disulfide reductase